MMILESGFRDGVHVTRVAYVLIVRTVYMLSKGLLVMKVADTPRTMLYNHARRAGKKKVEKSGKRSRPRL